MPHGYLPYLIAALVAGMVIRRSLSHRRIRVDSLWIIPALLSVAAVMTIAQSPPRDILGIAGSALAALIGAAVGWQRGRLTRINIDPATGTLMSKASPAGVILILGLFALRYGLRYWLQEHPQKGDTLVNATDALMLFSCAMLIVARVEMWIRCRRLMAAGAGTL